MDIIEALGFTAIPAITVICYLLAEGIKAAGINTKWLPIICGVAGLVLGEVGMIIMADFPAADLLTAAAVGIVSGLAATGINQAIKQLTGEK